MLGCASLKSGAAPVALARALPEVFLEWVTGILNGEAEMLTGISIRHAKPDDAEAVRKVILAAYAPWFEKLPDLPDVSGGVCDDIEARRVWVAEHGDVIVGCLIGGVVGDHWHVANVAVSPEHAGQGIGRRLMEHAVEEALRANVFTMALATHRDMPGNVVLYEKLGWQVSGEAGTKIMMRRDIPK